jgi:hypothetical protein
MPAFDMFFPASAALKHSHPPIPPISLSVHTPPISSKHTRRFKFFENFDPQLSTIHRQPAGQHVFLRRERDGLQVLEVGPLQTALRQGVPNWRNLRHETGHESLLLGREVQDLHEDRHQGESHPQGGRQNPPLEEGIGPECFNCESSG